MTMDELSGALTRTRLRADPIELLVLSACETALGAARGAGARGRRRALGCAQREMIASETLSHPFYWSAFVLIRNGL
jgi:CHAT domain-containing protein